MRDRVPTPGRENRVKITQDDGTVVAGVLEYDDQATQEGSPYTRGNVLPDDVCNAYNLDKVTSEPKDAFLAVPGIMGKALLTITVTKINGQPYSGVVVNGLTGIDTPRRKTNSEGKVVVYVDAGTYNLTFSPNPVCVDTSIPGKSVTVAAGGVRSVSTKEQSNGLTSLTITSSRTVAFSANVTNLDAFLVGGGGAGCGKSASGDTTPGLGGGGGRTATYRNLSISKYTQYSAVVGSGATGTSGSGGTGGSTSIFAKSVIGGTGGSMQSGGNGGSGGGGRYFINDGASYRGGNGGTDGGNGEGQTGSAEGRPGGTGQGSTTRAFGEATGDLYAGGGGGGSQSVFNPGNGGSGGGGSGGGINANGVSGTANTGGGGGGAGHIQGSGTAYLGGNGGSGIILLRWVNAA